MALNKPEIGQHVLVPQHGIEDDWYIEVIVLDLLSAQFSWTTPVTPGVDIDIYGYTTYKEDWKPYVKDGDKQYESRIHNDNE